MAETCSLLFSTFSSHLTISPFRHSHPSAARFSSLLSRVRPSRFAVKASHYGSFSDDDSFNFFPWLKKRSMELLIQVIALFCTEIEWVPEERITLFTTDGLVQIGGNMSHNSKTSQNVEPVSNKKHGRSKSPEKHQKFQESAYMDPAQGLCLGALFDIAATNGLDMGRRLCIFGFCRSVEMLSDVVEDTVLEHGGEIVATETESTSGLQEKLTMTVAVPYLWGVPPAAERLHLAVRTGGGIVDKVYWQWHFL
ncbi:uncharacterized protein LOC9315697 [Arabidopsis lyrata subsp. lyrata]|uniref:uncharacterized protein LOC9315697 n=1 Tax=Arabidopsis lyrata subsp. lyrata TaxID=81972 RepID=UPI000A29A86E|nr:uncharacterized protein LOC9315697 [Arabidopsis lyrata subsp. lyrata]|eukprot:XP_020884742.1 uncharacterized protein LOC9315697 [Arabidopsis lyrata subsp. lyrata]